MIGVMLPFVDSPRPMAFGVGIFVLVWSSPNPSTFLGVVPGSTRPLAVIVNTTAAAAVAAVVHAGYLQTVDHFLHHKVGEGVAAASTTRWARRMDAESVGSSSALLAARGVCRRLITEAFGAEGMAAPERPRILEDVLADRTHQAGVGRRQEER